MVQKHQITHRKYLSSHGANLSVSYNKNGWTNKLGISVNEYGSQYKLKIIINNGDSYIKTNGEYEFETASKIDSSLSDVQIKSIEFQLLDNNSSDKIVAKQYIDTSNYDPLAPAINGDITVNKDYSSMNTIAFKATDSGSGLKRFKI